MFALYWNLRSRFFFKNFYEFIHAKINITYTNSKPGSNRSKNFQYTFTTDDVRIQVYKNYSKNFGLIRIESYLQSRQQYVEIKYESTQTNISEYYR